MSKSHTPLQIKISDLRDMQVPDSQILRILRADTHTDKEQIRKQLLRE